MTAFLGVKASFHSEDAFKHTCNLNTHGALMEVGDAGALSNWELLHISLWDLWFKSRGTVPVPCFCLFEGKVWSRGLDRIGSVSGLPRWQFVIGRRLCEQTLCLISKKKKKLAHNSVFPQRVQTVVISRLGFSSMSIFRDYIEEDINQEWIRGWQLVSPAWYDSGVIKFI